MNVLKNTCEEVHFQSKVASCMPLTPLKINSYTGIFSASLIASIEQQQLFGPPVVAGRVPCIPPSFLRPSVCPGVFLELYH